MCEDRKRPAKFFPSGKEIQQNLFKTNVQVQLQVWKSPCFSLKTSGRGYRKKNIKILNTYYYFVYFHLYIFSGFCGIKLLGQVNIHFGVVQLFTCFYTACAVI